MIPGATSVTSFAVAVLGASAYDEFGLLAKRILIDVMGGVGHERKESFG